MRIAIVKRVLGILMLLSAFATPLCAQRQALKNMPYADQRRFHYGFLLGIQMADAVFEHTGLVQDNGASWYADMPGSNPGFSVGLLGDMAFTEFLNLRCTPTFSFVTRSITLHNASTHEEINQNLKSAYLELPISLKFSAHRINNYRPYILGGFSISYDMAQEKETPLVFKHADFGLHIAVGCDNYLPFFKFVPELRFNFGLADMLDHDRKDLKDKSQMQYTQAVSKARNKSVSLIFYFE